MQIEPYHFFHGRCEEALTFYAKALGGEIVHLSRFADSPMAAQVPAEQRNGVMHATLVAGGVRFMASDGRPGAGPDGEDDIALSLATTDDAEGERVFAALSEGGTIEMPLAVAFWGGKFGQLVDRFGIQWMLSIHDA